MPSLRYFWQYLRWGSRTSSTRSSLRVLSRGIILNGGGFRAHIEWDIPLDQVLALHVDFKHGGKRYRATLTGVFPTEGKNVHVEIKQGAEDGKEDRH